MVADNFKSVLLVGDFDKEEEALIRSVCVRLRCRFSRVHDWRKVPYQKDDFAQVVIAQSEGSAWNWKTILDHLQRAVWQPHLIVTSRTADERLWAEVLNLGGYDVLAQPFDRDEVERVVASAARRDAAIAPESEQSGFIPQY
jgi:DNA-binding response OmpR family regulator